MGAQGCGDLAGELWPRYFPMLSFLHPGKVAPLLVAAILLGAIFVLWMLVRMRVAQWLKTLAVVACLGMIWTLLTEV